MMMNEFTERTGIEPNAEEYAVIEAMYYEFDGDMNAFCKEFIAKGWMIEAQRKVAKDLQASLDEMHKSMDVAYAEIKSANKLIASLKEKLEREQEWRPWTNENAVKQEDYDHLRKAGRAMTDDEAKDWIASEWGFDREKIRIYREMKTFEKNRHSMLRQVGQIDRDPYYEATDWYYVFFRVCGMEYEAYNGSLKQL